MNRNLIIAIGLLLVVSTVADAQRKRGSRPQGGNQQQRGSQSQQKRSGGAMNVPDNKQAIGDAGIAWYTTWETGLAEAKRSNRPIFFMSAATACSGVPGVF